MLSVRLFWPGVAKHFSPSLFFPQPDRKASNSSHEKPKPHEADDDKRELLHVCFNRHFTLQSHTHGYVLLKPRIAQQRRPGLSRFLRTDQVETQLVLVRIRRLRLDPPKRTAVYVAHYGLL